MKRNRVMVYPYDKEFLSLLRHSNKINQFEITNIVSPFGWGFNGKDAGVIDYGEPLGIIVKDNFDLALNECDTVIFNKPLLELNYEKFIKSKISTAIEKNKNIICLARLEDNDRSQFEIQCRSKGLTFEYYSNSYEYDNALKEVTKVSEINSPIVFVMGLSEDTNKFGVQLALRKKFMENGYKVSQIGSRSYSGFLGFNPMPDFMFNNQVADYEKIMLFNRFVKNIEEEEKPDVIIVGIPGGIMPINSNFPNKFGITAFEISRAITPDATVLCTHYNMFYKEYFENIMLLLKYRFSAELSCYYVNNTMLDFMNQDIQNDISLININFEKVSEEAKRNQKMGVPMYSSVDDVYVKIEEVLNSYAAIDSI